MFGRTLGILIVVFAMACVVVVGTAGDRQFGYVPKAELSATLGGGCQDCAAINDGTGPCQIATTCTESGEDWLNEWGTGTLEMWCDTVEGYEGVCNCNQTGITKSACVKNAYCYDDQCTNCQPEWTVSEVLPSCNMDGAPCDEDADCE